MRSPEHAKHLLDNKAWNNCQECNADTERRFIRQTPWREYKFVHEYLEYVKPRLAAMDDSIDARRWHRIFIKALHTRISLRSPSAGRKQSDGYLERLGQFINRQYPTGGKRFYADAGYLRQFARSGASAL